MRPYQSLRGRREFALVLRKGRAVPAKHLIVIAFSPRMPATRSTRIGIVITKKVGKAVVRNRLRRRCKAILDAAAAADSGIWYVVQFRPSAAVLPYAHLRDMLAGAFAASTRTVGTGVKRATVSR
jgi:ribonuclease P protein component